MYVPLVHQLFTLRYYVTTCAERLAIGAGDGVESCSYVFRPKFHNDNKKMLASDLNLPKGWPRHIGLTIFVIELHQWTRLVAPDSNLQTFDILAFNVSVSIPVIPSFNPCSNDVVIGLFSIFTSSTRSKSAHRRLLWPVHLPSRLFVVNSTTKYLCVVPPFILFNFVKYNNLGPPRKD